MENFPEDIRVALMEGEWNYDSLPNVRESADWNLLIPALTPQQLVRLKNVLFPPAPAQGKPLPPYNLCRMVSACGYFV